MYLKWTHEQCMYCAHFSALYCAHYLQTLQIVLLIQTIHEFLPVFVFVRDINGCYIIHIEEQYNGGVLRTPFTSCGLGSWFMRPAMLTLPWQNIINIQTHMCSKYKYKCIQNTNIIVSYMQIQINLRSVDWVVGLWDLTCWHCRDKKTMGVSECTKIQIHENRRKKPLFLQTQIMHCPVELMLLQNSVGWIRCIVVLD